MTLHRHICSQLVLMLVLAVRAAAQGLYIESTGGVPGRVCWESEVGVSYYLYGSENLKDWASVDAFPQDGTGETMQHLFTGGDRGFFRSVEAAPAPDGFRLIPSGTFLMGNAMDVNEGQADEQPVHSVHVSVFYMAEDEVSQSLWDDVRTWALTHGYTNLAAGASKGTNHPIHSIKWYDAVKWCNARSEKEGLLPCYHVAGVVYRTGNSDDVTCDFSAGRGYRLPTEAEWEKAARGWSVQRRFPSGDTITQGQANYYSTSYYPYDLAAVAGFHPGYNDGVTPYTAPVGAFAPNGYGIRDTAGNVFEWCWDWYSAASYETSPGMNPRGPASGSCRVFRGGGWHAFGSPRVAYRSLGFPGHSYYDLGFRLVRTVTP